MPTPKQNQRLPTGGLHSCQSLLHRKSNTARTNPLEVGSLYDRHTPMILCVLAALLSGMQGVSARVQGL
jgi:hypothetical protein